MSLRSFGLWKSSRGCRRDRGQRPRGRRPSFAEATAQPLLEFVERQLRGIFVGTPSPDFIDLFVGEPIDTFVLRFHQHQQLRRVLLALSRPGEHAVEDSLHLLFAHVANISRSDRNASERSYPFPRGKTPALALSVCGRFNGAKGHPP